MDKDRGKLCTSFTAYSLPYTGDQGVNAPSFFFLHILDFLKTMVTSGAAISDKGCGALTVKSNKYKLQSVYLLRR